MIKKMILFLMLIAISISCSKSNDKESKMMNSNSEIVVSNDGIIKILPENTEFLAKFSSLKDMYKYFSITENSIFGGEIDNLREIENDLGFNPFSLTELKDNGFSIDNELGFSIEDFRVKKNGSISDDTYIDDDDIEFNGALFIPVHDVKKAIIVIEKLIKKNNDDMYNRKKTTFEKVGNFYELKADDFTSYIIEKDGYLIFTGNPKKGQDTKEYLSSLVSGNYGSLSDSPVFQDVAKKVSSGEEIFFYVNAKKILEKNIDEIKKFADNMNDSYSTGMPDFKANYDYVKAFEGAGISIDLENKDFVVNSLLNVKKDSELLKLSKGVKYNKGISLGLDSEPLFLTSFSVNAEEYFKMFINSLGNNESEQINAAIDMVKANYGFDIEKDFIEQLGGNLNLGIYDASSINMMNYNILATISVKDEAKFKKTLDNMIDKLVPPDQKQMISKQTIDGVEAYVYLAGFQQLFIGIKDNNVIITVGKAMFEKALKADISNGFVNDINDDYLKKVLKSDTNIMYFNVPEVYKVYNTFSGLLNGFLGASDPNSAEEAKQTIKDITEKFKYILASSYVNGESFQSDFVIKTNFSKPFMIGIKELVDENK